MMRSLFSGVAGLKCHQTRMDSIGNNIANVNTPGFKSSRVTFIDTLTQTLSGASAATGTIGGTNAKQIGLGVGIGGVDTIFTDGSVQSTGNNTDLCLSGSGLFVVKSSSGTYYTRNGAFQTDAAGNFVTSSGGLFVQGWMASGTGDNRKIDTTGATTNITGLLAGKPIAATPSGTVTLSNNLSSSTPGSTINNIQVKYVDGTSATVTSYTPTTIQKGGITLKLSTGELVTVDDGGTWNVGDSVSGKTLYTSPVASITANATGTVDLTTDIGSYTAVNGGTGPISITGLTSGTYTKGDSYQAHQKIQKVTANSDNTVTLTFEPKSAGSETDAITSVTVPAPENGTYAKGDFFDVKLNITGAKGLADADLKMENGQSAKATTTISIGDSFTKIGGSETIDAITRTEKGKSVYMLNGKEVSSVSITDTTGATQSGLMGQTYAKDGMFYPSVATTVSAFDSQGNTHTVPVLLTKTAANTWGLAFPGGGNTYTVKEADGSTTTMRLTSTALKFTDKGTYDSGTASISMEYSNGVTPGKLDFNLSSLTQYSSESTLASKADGCTDGALKSISIDSQGVITGSYTNGVNQVEAQVAIAAFNNPAGLTKSGSSLYSISNNSGAPNVKSASALGVKITPSALEMSNVDLANEFSDMIVTQRGFQSNSKIITVSDEMLETLVNMKR